MTTTTPTPTPTLAQGDCVQPRYMPGDPWQHLLGSYKGRCDQGCTWNPGERMHCSVCHALFGELAVHCPTCHETFASETAFRYHHADLGRSSDLTPNMRGQWAVASSLHGARERLGGHRVPQATPDEG